MIQLSQLPRSVASFLGPAPGLPAECVAAADGGAIVDPATARGKAGPAAEALAEWLAIMVDRAVFMTLGSDRLL